MGIVVSSRQASNILWHSVTCLNAICVLISSLQPPWPLEKRGVRWFSFFHSPLLLLCLQFCLSVSLSPHVVPCPLFPHSLSFCSFLFHIPFQLYHWVSEEESFHQTKGVSIFFFMPLSVVYFQDADRSTVRQIVWLPVHPCICVPAPWDSGVQHVSLLSF